MYKAVVIDDEPWVIKTLVDSVRWSDLNFEIVGTASESKKGFEMIRSLRPDLVFIDIRMPEMSGLECMKQAKALQIPSLFVVVSGFAEFSYAQKCMQLGAVGYCLKPIDEDEIEALLRKVKEDLDTKQSKEAPSLIERIMEDAAGVVPYLASFLAAKGFTLTNECPLLAVCCVGVEEPLDLFGFRHAVIYQSSRKTILLVQEEPHVSLSQYLSSGHPAGYKIKGIGISAPVARLDLLKQAVEEAELAAHQYFLTGSDTVCQAFEDGEPDFSELRELYPALQRGDMTELEAMFDRYAAQMKSGRFRVKHALLLYHTVMTAIVHSDSAENPGEPYLIHDYELLIERYGTAEDMVKDLKRMTVAYLGNMFSESTRHVRSDSFKAVLNYIHDHYYEEITLQKLSDTFFINPNYISQLFIKHLGKPFTVYLSELRVRNACRKLKSSNKSIQEIAADVGIPDPYYFSKIFRKITGVTPREYRKSE